MTEPTDRQLLELLLTKISQLTEFVSRMQCPTDANTADIALLRSIFNSTAGLRFTCPEVVLEAQLAAQQLFEEPGDPELQNVIVAAVGQLSARKLGSRLARLEGAPTGGYLVQRLTPTRNGMQWRVVKM